MCIDPKKCIESLQNYTEKLVYILFDIYFWIKFHEQMWCDLRNHTQTRKFYFSVEVISIWKKNHTKSLTIRRVIAEVWKGKNFLETKRSEYLNMTFFGSGASQNGFEASQNKLIFCNFSIYDRIKPPEHYILHV